MECYFLCFISQVVPRLFNQIFKVLDLHILIAVDTNQIQFQVGVHSAIVLFLKSIDLDSLILPKFIHNRIPNVDECVLLLVEGSLPRGDVIQELYFPILQSK